MEKKLRLDPDALSVEPFAMEPAREESGTVLGFDDAATKNQISCRPPTGYPLCVAC